MENTFDKTCCCIHSFFVILVDHSLPTPTFFGCFCFALYISSLKLFICFETYFGFFPKDRTDKTRTTVGENKRTHTLHAHATTRRQWKEENKKTTLLPSATTMPAYSACGYVPTIASHQAFCVCCMHPTTYLLPLPHLLAFSHPPMDGTTTLPTTHACVLT